ncbi:MAG: PQQ-binding-like beta-propeller repeat protein [Chloroflexota bacterium]
MAASLRSRTLCAVALALTLVLPVAAPLHAASGPAGPWPGFHGDSQHTGLASVNGPRLLALAWYASAGDDVDASAVIGADGTVYISTTDGTVQALSPEGGQKWVYEAGARIYASPVLATDGRILIGDTRGRFRALNPSDGTVAWTVSGLGSIRGAAVVSGNGTVYVGTEAGQLLALDERDGSEQLRKQTAAGVVAAPAIAPTGDVYWSALDGKLRRMSATGNDLWEVAVDGNVVSAPAIGPDGTVYVGAGASILAIAPESGAIKWRVGAGADVMTTPAIGPNGTIYTGADNGLFTAVGPSGSVRWQAQTGAAIRSSAAVGADGIVYVGSGDGTIYAFHPTGQRLSNYRALAAVHGSVSIGPNGVVYAGSRDNRLYALRDNVRPLTESPPGRLGGSLVRDPATGKVFVIVDGQRRHIPDPETQLLLRLAGPLPRDLNASELAAYPEGPALPSLAEGTLLRANNGPIYVIRGGERLWIRSLADFAAGGYRWESVVPVEDRLLRSLPLSLEGGMLLKGTGERVYLYDGGQRRWISSGDVFTARGYTWSQVHLLAEDALAALPEGQALS